MCFGLARFRSYLGLGLGCVVVVIVVVRLVVVVVPRLMRDSDDGCEASVAFMPDGIKSGYYTALTCMHKFAAVAFFTRSRNLSRSTEV